MAHITLPLLTAAISGLIPLVAGHAAFFHPSMWGFNVTMQTFPYDNRPVAPLTEYTFDQWWFHGHLDYPPNEGDIFELPAGQPVTTQVACDKGATTFFASDPGGNIQNGDDPCPGSPPSEYHTTGFDDLKGCALAITYQSNVSDVQPEDFTVFSVNQTCVWYRFTDFQIPARMPACPPGGCICAWFWIHSPDSGSEQNYMNGFRCNVTGATSDVALAQPQVPRRCGADPDNDRPDANFGNCTWGAKQPFYWLQQERNNMFEGYYSPPFYTNLYNFLDGAQEDIFEDSYPDGLPTPTVNGTVPTPNFAGVQPTATPSAPSGLPEAIVGTPAPASTASTSAASGGGTTTSGTANSSLLSTTTSMSSPSGSGSSTLAAASSTSTSSPTNGTDAVSVSIVVSTATVISTQVVTVTAPSASASTSPASNVILSVASAPNVSSSALSTLFSSATPAASSAASSQLSSSTASSSNMSTPAGPSASSALSSSTSTSILPATSTLLLNTPSLSSTHADVNLASPTGTSSSSSSSSSGLTCATKNRSRAVLGKRSMRRSTESGFQELWEAVKPDSRRQDVGFDSDSSGQLRRREAEEYKPARRSRLWRVI